MHVPSKKKRQIISTRLLNRSQGRRLFTYIVYIERVHTYVERIIYNYYVSLVKVQNLKKKFGFFFLTAFLFYCSILFCVDRSCSDYHPNGRSQFGARLLSKGEGVAGERRIPFVFVMEKKYC